MVSNFAILGGMSIRAIFFILLCALSAMGQFTAQEMLQPACFTNQSGSVIEYRISKPQFPEPGRRYPLILFLHGSGECGTDNIKQSTVGVPVLLNRLLRAGEPCVVVAPQCSKTNWWVRGVVRKPGNNLTPQPLMSSLQNAVNLCLHLVEVGIADKERLYVTGLSLGGYGTWEAVQNYPEIFAAAVPICGGGYHGSVAEIRKLPIWVFHGSEDRAVPVACSRVMVEALKRAGNRKLRYTEYEGGKHAIWDRAYAEPELIEWLLKQSRKPKPWWKIWQR